MKNIICIILVFMTASCNSQNRSGEIDNIIEDFFLAYEKKDPDSSLKLLFSSNEHIETKDILPLKERIIQYSNLLGDYISNELLINKQIGKSLEIRVYMVNYDRQPIQFIFTFYKPKDNWKIFNFRINDDLTTQIEKAIAPARILSSDGYE